MRRQTRGYRPNRALAEEQVNKLRDGSFARQGLEASDGRASDEALQQALGGNRVKPLLRACRDALSAPLSNSGGRVDALAGLSSQWPMGTRSPSCGSGPGLRTRLAQHQER